VLDGVAAMHRGGRRPSIGVFTKLFFRTLYDEPFVVSCNGIEAGVLPSPLSRPVPRIDLDPSGCPMRSPPCDNEVPSLPHLTSPLVRLFFFDPAQTLNLSPQGLTIGWPALPFFTFRTSFFATEFTSPSVSSSRLSPGLRNVTKAFRSRLPGDVCHLDSVLPLLGWKSWYFRIMFS